MTMDLDAADGTKSRPRSEVSGTNPNQSVHRMNPTAVSQTKQFRKDLDGILQQLKSESGETAHTDWCRASRERSLAIMKIQEAIMWLGMDLKAIAEETGEGQSPYPNSYNPSSPVIEPTADGLKL